MAQRPLCPTCKSTLRSVRFNAPDGAKCTDEWHLSETGPDRADSPIFACPFPGCHANLTMVVEADQRLRYPQHDVVSTTAGRYGRCPASLMAEPLSQAAIDILGREYETFRRLRDEQRAAEPAAGGGQRKEHPSTPHPDPRHPWANLGPGGGRPGPNGGQNVDRSGHLRPEDLDPRRIPGTPGRPLGRPADTAGGSMSSRMEEAAGMNQAGIAKAEEAAATVRVAQEACDEIYGLFSLAHDASQQDASRESMEHVGSAKEKLSEALAALGAAVEAAGRIVF